MINNHATIELWNRLVRPFDPASAVEALTGLPATTARQIVGTRIDKALMVGQQYIHLSGIGGAWLVGTGEHQMFVADHNARKSSDAINADAQP